MIKTEKDLKNIVKRNIDNAVNYSEEVGKDRKQGHKLYYMKPFGNEREGRSQYVSPDVFFEVEHAKSQILSSVTSNRKVARFNNDALTEYAHHVMFKDNKGYEELRDCIDDGLKLKTGVMKCYWKQDSRFETETFEGLNEYQLNQLLSQDGIELVFDKDENGNDVPRLSEQVVDIPLIDPLTGTELITSEVLYSGEVEREVDTSRICIKAVPIERFLINPEAESLEDATFSADYERVTKSKLLAMGYDADLVSQVSTSKHLDDEEYDTRSPYTSQELSSVSADMATEYVNLYQCFITVDLEENGRQRVIKVDIAGDVILDSEEIIKIVYHKWNPIPISHVFHGMSLPDVLEQTMYAASMSMRSKIDYDLMVSNPRYKANLKKVKNVRDLIDNKIGGVIASEDIINDIAPLQIPASNPSSFAVHELIEKDREKISGSSRLSKGMNEQVLSSQNHKDTINAMKKSGEIRISTMTKNFVEGVLKPLMIDIIEIGREYDNRQIIIKLDGKPTPFNPKKVQDAGEVEVSVALTEEDGYNRAQQRLLMLGSMRQDPIASQLVGEQQTYAIYKDVMEDLGMDNPAYIINPQDPQYQQSKQQQLAQQNAQMQQQIQLTMSQLQLANKQLEIDKYKHDDKMMLEREKQDHKEFMDTHERKMDHEELNLERGQDRNVSIGR